MKCPHDDVALLMTERQGIEIDYCPECRGVWLDRGELDKILERSHAEVVGSAPAAASYPTAPPEAGRREEPRYDDRDRDRDRYRDDRDRYRDDRRGYDGAAYTKHKKKKKTSFLEDLFEFGG
jgi:Zn-finger nucleic acid-binding protein